MWIILYHAQKLALSAIPLVCGSQTCNNGRHPINRSFTMSRERCIAFMHDLEYRDLERIKPWFAEKSVLWMPPTTPIEGQRRILAMFRVIFRMYTEIHWKVTDVYPAGGNRYIYATDSWGIIGKSTPYKNSILTIIDFDNEGHILYLSDYFKDTAIFNAEKPAATISAPAL